MNRICQVLLLLIGASGLLTAGEIRFQEVAKDWGLSFQHHHGGSGERYLVETMVGGLALFDYDQDGDVDVFFVDGGELPGYEGEKPRSRLFRNDGEGRFVDVTAAAGLEFDAYGTGANVGDFDGDGDPDLYLAIFGRNLLFRNESDGTFTEVAAEVGVDDPLWSFSTGFADVDRDGDLDLYVANYVDFSMENHKFCGDKNRMLPGYCHPGAYDGLPDTFYRNRGDGTYEIRTEEAGFGHADDSGLGLLFSDLDNDGWIDLYVANDADPNFLFMNRGDGTFEDMSLLSGASFSDTGSPEAGMGVDAGDVDGDGLMDIVVTNFELETNALYKNIGGGIFTEGRYLSNVGEPSLPNLGFGLYLGDLDQDGDLDMAVANGHILDNAQDHKQGSNFGQTNQILENQGNGRFQVVRDFGVGLARPGRGLAAADLDGDGDLDLAILNSADLSEVYENISNETGPGRGAGWLQFDLDGAHLNRFGVGGRIELRSGGKLQLRESRTASSYVSHSASTLHFGLPEGGAVDELTVRWPAGAVQRLAGLPLDRRYRLYESR